MVCNATVLAGELYSQAQGMFDMDMYKQLISVVDTAIREAKINNNTFEADYVNIFPLLLYPLVLFPFTNQKH